MDRDAGIWVDGNYVGYVKELKDGKKVLLLPGKHHIMARQEGYSDWTRELARGSIEQASPGIKQNPQPH